MKRVIRSFVFVVLLVILLLAMDSALRREDGKRKYSAFYEETTPIDVFFLGTSHVMDAVYPMELWRDYGFTSYNFGNPSETPEATYWTLRLALQEKKPKLVVMDVCYIGRSQSDSGNTALSHIFLDQVPLSLEKLRAINALFPKGSRAEFIFPLIANHSRWEELLEGVKDTTACLPCMRGAELRIGRAKPAPFTRTQETDETLTAGKQAICSIIELCQREGIDIALMSIPYPADETTQKMMNSAQAIADSYGIPFYNLFDVDGLVNFETDCYDAMSHLNPDGAIKVSAWLGEALSTRYALENHGGENEYADWDDALEQYEHILHEEWGPQSLL